MFKITNKNEIQRNFDIWESKINKTVDKTLLEIGERSEVFIRNNTPVVSGRLRNSFGYTVKDKLFKYFHPQVANDVIDRTREKQVLIIGTNVVYAESVEYRSKTGSRGFFYRAYKQVVKNAQKVMKVNLKKVLR